MPTYLLLLRDDDTFPDMAPEAMQALVERYMQWSGALAARGALVGGQKLTDRAGRVVSRGARGVSVTDGPYVEGKELVGGYFLVTAASFDEAAALAQDCPHLELGSIEIREIEKMGDGERTA